MTLHERFEIKTVKNRLNMSIALKDSLQTSGFLPSSKFKLSKEEKEELKQIRDALEENSAHTLGAVYLKLKGEK